MGKEQKVYMPLMIGDWLKGTRGMKAVVRGVYINLLLYQWDNGYIPSDMETLSLIDPEVGSVWVTLKSKFEEFEPGKLRNPKNDEVKAFWSKQKSNGLLGGRPPGSSKPRVLSQAQIDWEEMVTFFDNTCVNCGHKFAEDQRPTKDHIVAQLNGGADEIWNFQPLCRQCNSSKQATHSTDYRLKFIAKIPPELRDKWFQVNPKITQNKPKHQTKNNLHNDLDHDIALEDKLKGALDELYLDGQRPKWGHINFDFELNTFMEKVRGSPGHYAGHNTDGIRLAFQKQLREAKHKTSGTPKNNSNIQHIAGLAEARRNAKTR